MEVISLPDLEGELEDALLCSVTDGKVIVHSENNEIRIYDRQSHEIERHICPSGYRQRKGNTNEKHYNCFCNVTSDAVYHSCVTHEENERGSFSVEIEIYKLVDKSMRNVKTLKYYNASNFRVYGSFYIELNKKWITFSLEVMKEIVFNDCHSFAVFAYHDHFYAFDGVKLHLLVIGNAGEQIEFAEEESLEGDTIDSWFKWFLKTHAVGEDVFIVNFIGELWRLNMPNRKIDKLPIELPHPSSCTFCDNILYFTKHSSHAIHRIDLAPYLSTQRETTNQEELIPKVCNTTTNVVEIVKPKNMMCATPAVERNQKEPTFRLCFELLRNPMPKCGHSLCDCEVVVELKMHERLPTNSALKDHLHDICCCCDSVLPETSSFTCALCSDGRENSEMYFCGQCVLKYHSEHFASVKRVTFADDQYKKQQIADICRNPIDPACRKAPLASKIEEEVNKQLNIFFENLREDCRSINWRIEKLTNASRITKEAVDKEAGEIRDADKKIAKKFEKLYSWKAQLLRDLGELNSHKRN